MVLNHENKSLFFNSTGILEDLSTKPKRKKYFSYLIKETETLKIRHNDPKEEYYTPEKTKCHFCEYKKQCPKAIK